MAEKKSHTLLFNQEFDSLRQILEGPSKRGCSLSTAAGKTDNDIKTRVVHETFTSKLSHLKKLKQLRSTTREQNIKRLQLLRDRVTQKSEKIKSAIRIKNVNYERRLHLQASTVTKRLQELIFECVGEIEKVCLESALHSEKSATSIGNDVDTVAIARHWLGFIRRIQEDSIGAIEVGLPKIPRQGTSKPSELQVWKQIKQKLVKAVQNALKERNGTAPAVTIDHFATVHLPSRKFGNHEDPPFVRGADRSICKSKRLRQTLFDVLDAPQGQAPDVSLATPQKPGESNADKVVPKVKTLSGPSAPNRLTDALYHVAGVCREESAIPATPSTSFANARSIMEEYASTPSEAEPSMAPAGFFRRVRQGTRRLPQWDPSTPLCAATLRWLLSCILGPEADLHCARVYYTIADGPDAVAGASTSLVELSASPNARMAATAAKHQILQSVYGKKKAASDPGFRNRVPAGRFGVVERKSEHRKLPRTKDGAFNEHCISCGHKSGNELYRNLSRTSRSRLNRPNPSQKCQECAARAQLAHFPDVIVGTPRDQKHGECLHFAMADISTLLCLSRFKSLDLCSLPESDRKALQTLYGIDHKSSNVGKPPSPSLYIMCTENTKAGTTREVLVRLPSMAVDELIHLYLIRSNVLPPTKETKVTDASINGTNSLENGQVANCFIPAANAVSLWSAVEAPLLEVTGSPKAVAGMAVLDITTTRQLDSLFRQVQTSVVRKKVGQSRYRPMDSTDDDLILEPSSSSSTLQGLIFAFTQQPADKENAPVLLNIEGTVDLASAGTSEVVKLCEWRSCLSPATTHKHLALRERATVKQQVCRHHGQLIDQLITLPNGIQEIKRHVPRKQAAEYKKKTNGSLRQTKREHENALIKSSSLVSELLNQKLANTISGFCSRAAAAARPKRPVGSNGNEVGLTGAAKVAKVETQERNLREESLLLEKIAQVECRVKSELELFEQMGVFPGEELSAIRHEYNVLSEQKSMLLGTARKNNQSDELEDGGALQTKQRKRGKIKPRKLEEVPQFLLVRLCSLEQGNDQSWEANAFSQQGAPQHTQPAAVLDTLGLRSVIQPASFLTLSHLELEFSLRKFVVLSKKRRELEAQRLEGREPQHFSTGTKVRARLQQRLNESIRYSTL